MFCPTDPGLSFKLLAAKIILNRPLPNLFEVLMNTLRKLFFFFLTLVILGAGGCSQQGPEKWWRKAAEQGHATSQFKLGEMYWVGEGVPKDYKEAFKWFQMAAGQGNASAQYNLGVMYGKGQGVPRDYVLAYMWNNLSNSNTTEEDHRQRTDKAFNLLEKKMTQEQISEAQRLSREWKSKGRNE